jgi:Domain of unknown function (DUF4124)
MPRKNRIAALALVTVAALITVKAERADAEIYKQIDKDGRVTYSNTPMPGATATALDDVHAPSQEDVRAAQESTRQIEARAKEMEESRLRLEERRARLNMEERMYDAYLKQLHEPAASDDAAWFFAVGADSRRRDFPHPLRVHDGTRRRPAAHLRVGMDERPPR